MVVDGANKDLEYDEAGNLTTDQAGYEYSYDYENRLSLITDGTDNVAAYTYDAPGRRVEKLQYDTDGDPESTTQYYYDGWRVLREAHDSLSDVEDYFCSDAI